MIITSWMDLMTEKFDGNSSENARYLYRFDRLDLLTNQRKTEDRLLRAARRTGSEKLFPHFQVKQAHDLVSVGQAVYRICFWKTLADALDWPGATDGWALQRVASDHSFFKDFGCGDDEYLPESALIFWGTFQVDDDCPDWSPVGIPHSDIDVLTPDGWWRQMDEVAFFRDQDPEWGVYHLGSSVLQVRTGRLAGAEQDWVFIRQRSGSGKTFLTDPYSLAPLITVIGDGLPVEPSGYRWAYAVEFPDQVVVKELQCQFVAEWPPGLRGWLARLRKQNAGVTGVVSRDRPWGDRRAVVALYASFGIEEMLWRGESWNYHPFRRSSLVPQ